MATKIVNLVFSGAEMTAGFPFDVVWFVFKVAGIDVVIGIDLEKVGYKEVSCRTVEGV